MEGEEVGCCLCKDYSVSATSGVPGVARLLMYRSSEQSLYLWSLSCFQMSCCPQSSGVYPDCMRDEGSEWCARCSSFIPPDMF